MARIEVDIEEGNIANVPAELQAIFQRIETEAHGKGYGKGAQKAAEEAKAQIESAVRDAVAKAEAIAPVEREKFAEIDAANKALRQQYADQMRESDRTLKAREEQHARELIARSEAVKVREERLRELTGDHLRALALGAGAREESLDELSVILGSAIGYDEDMKPFPKAADGKQHMTLGKPTSLDVFVKQYLETHPHHRKPAAGAGGGSRGGHTFQSFGQRKSDVADFEAATSRIASGDRSADAVNDVFLASRRKREAS